MIEFKPKTFKCPIHGDIGDLVISSNIPDYQGIWCQRCWIKTFDKLGISRVEQIDAETKFFAQEYPGRTTSGHSDQHNSDDPREQGEEIPFGEEGC